MARWCLCDSTIENVGSVVSEVGTVFGSLGSPLLLSTVLDTALNLATYSSPDSRGASDATASDTTASATTSGLSAGFLAVTANKTSNPCGVVNASLSRICIGAFKIGSGARAANTSIRGIGLLARNGISVMLTLDSIIASTVRNGGGFSGPVAGVRRVTILCPGIIRVIAAGGSNVGGVRSLHNGHVTINSRLKL